MLSDSPPDRDVIWTEAGVEGAHRHIQRVWRLVNDVIARTPKDFDQALPSQFSADALDLRKTMHRMLSAVAEDIEKLGFNRAVARIYDATNAIGRALAGKNHTPDMTWSLNEATGLLVEAMAPMTPHLSEACWELLGRDGMLSTKQWSTVDRSLLEDDTITLPIQINGKKRGEIEVAKTADKAAVEAAVLDDETVIRFLDGTTPKRVIVVPQRIVNIVV
jgi:leucyl-tRNA synthetase